MKGLTQGPISRHLVEMAVPMAVGMLIQTLYFLVDLYFVAQLGDAAIAGVSLGGTVMYIVLGLTQMLGVGTVALISHAFGRKDQADANLVFNQYWIHPSTNSEPAADLILARKAFKEFDFPWKRAALLRPFSSVRSDYQTFTRSSGAR